MNHTKMNRGGREYLPAAHFMKKYELSASALRQAKKNGLPYIEERGVSYFSEQDFHDYFAGRIGNDVGGKNDKHMQPRGG